MRPLALLLVVAVAGNAWAAAPGATGIIVSFTGGGTREADLAATAAIVASPLAPLDPQWGASLAVKIDRAFGESPKRMSNRELADYPKKIQELDENLALDQGNSTRQIRKLEEMRRTLEESQGTLASDPSARKIYFSILEVLARTYYESDAIGKSQDCLAALAGTFPNQPLTGRSSKLFKQFYLSMLTKLAAPAPSEIVVEGMLRPPPSWRIYVNGRESEWRTPAIKAEYRIFVTTPSGDGRVHVVTVGEQTSTTRIDVAFDVALTTDKSVGLRFEDPEQQYRFEEPYALRIAKSVGLSTIILVSHGRYDGKTGLRLSAYGFGRPYQHEFVEAATPKDVSDDKVKSMALNLLRKIDQSQPIVVKTTPPAPPRATTPTKRPDDKTPPPAPPRATTPTKLLGVESPPLTVEKKSTFDELFEQAQEAYIHAHFVKAVDLSMAALKLARGEPDRQRAMRVLAASKCCAGDVQSAIVWLGKLKYNGRIFVRSVCRRSQSVDLPTDEKMGLRFDED